MSEKQTNAREVVGKVVSNRAKDTIVVMVERKVKHLKYGKYTKKTTKLHAHTTKPINIGDVVRLRETKPISKNKCWELVAVVD